MSEMHWNIASPLTEDERKQHPDLHPVVLQLLKNRGLEKREQMDAFLSPNYENDIHHPSLFKDMSTAVQRVFKALADGETIVVHGDYDADGICGTTALVTTLREIAEHSDGLTANVIPFLPDRERDGYGVAAHTVKRFSTDGVTLMITVDCGISNKESLAIGKANGMDAIVCDHHAIPPELPDAILIHPKVEGETYPNKHLCGTGVAAKLCWGLIEEAQKRGARLSEGYEKWLLDLVAIATVTDVVPLIGENRTLEHYGLTVLKKTRRPGLKKLIEVAGLKGKPIGTWNIGFQIGPRVNATGRMTHAKESFELLASIDDMEAHVRALEVDQVNRDRQKASDALYREAKNQEVDDAELLVFVGEKWSHGLIGLVAGKLLRDFGKPVFVVTKHGDRYTASGRSIPGFDITKAMQAGAEYYHKHGGHPQACGFTIIGEDNFNAAMEVAKGEAKRELAGQELKPTIDVDAELTMDDIDMKLVEQIQSLEPHGERNPRPIFVAKGVRVNRMMPVGKEGKHLRLSVADVDGDRTHNMICFRQGDLLEELSVGSIIDIAFELGINEWNGSRSVQLTFVDINY